MDEYIKQLLKDAGVPENLDPEVRTQLENDLSDRAADLVNRRLIDSMSDEDAQAFNDLIENRPDDIEAMQQFISDHVRNRDQVASAALLEFRALYLGPKA